jgi:hypothetical protein
MRKLLSAATSVILATNIAVAQGAETARDLAGAAAVYETVATACSLYEINVAGLWNAETIAIEKGRKQARNFDTMLRKARGLVRSQMEEMGGPESMCAAIAQSYFGIVGRRLGAPRTPLASLVINPSAEAAIDDLRASHTQSMAVDAVFVTMLNIHGVEASVPPARFDRPYPNVEVVYDLPYSSKLWGWTEMPKRPGGQCIIHLAPLGRIALAGGGIELLEAVGMPQLLRHEKGHCAGGVHPDNGDHRVWLDGRGATARR